jgi:hypothetical protein
LWSGPHLTAPSNNLLIPQIGDPDYIGDTPELLNSMKHFTLMIKVFYNNPAIKYKTLDKMRLVDHSNLEQYTRSVVSMFNVKHDVYKTTDATELRFTYIVKSGPITDKASFNS